MKKIILIVIGSLLLIYVAFLTEESIRLKNDIESKPLIVLDKVFCDKNDYACYDQNKEYNENYISVGFNLKRTYILAEDATEENVKYYLVAGELWLFDKFLIWGWIS